MNTRIGMIARLSLFLLALCGSGMASADFFPFELSPGETLGLGAEQDTGGEEQLEFTHDFWTFTLASPGSVSVLIWDDRYVHYENEGDPIYDPIDDLTGAINAGFSAGSDLNFTVAGLEANTIYTLTVSGVLHFPAGAYKLNISAVPLPPAAILFGSVLIGFVTMARKRRAGESALAA